VNIGLSNLWGGEKGDNADSFTLRIFLNFLGENFLKEIFSKK